MDKAFELTAAQRKAFNKLQDAFKECDKAGLSIYMSLETMLAINSKGLNGRKVVLDQGFSVSDQAESFRPDTIKGIYSDEALDLA